MGRFQFVILLFLPLFGFAQDYPRFELYQLVQGADSGQFVTTGVDSNLDFNSVLRFRFQDSTLLIGSDTVITDATIVPILLATIDAGLGIEVNQVNGQIFIESLSIEDSIYNGSGSIIPKGTPLYAVGEQGNYWNVAPARADDPSKMPVVVIAGEEIGIGEVGLGLIKGHIKQVNTTGLADGSQVYVGATGGYTSTKPTDEGVIIQRLGTVIKGENTNGSGIINLGDEGFWNDYTSLTKLRDTLVLVRGSITTEIGDSLTNYASRTELADTASAIRSDIPTGAITATNQGNNRIPTFATTNVIDGGNNFWINEFGEMVDDLSDGTSPTSVGYKIKIDDDVFFEDNYSTYTTVNTTFTSKGNSIFEGSVGNTTLNNGGQLGIQVTPSVDNHSLTTYWGAIFNTNKDVLTRGDFRINSSIDNMFVVDSDLDAIGIGGATPNSSFDININGGVQINSSASGGIYDGLIVQGDTDPVLFYVNADRDKVGVSEALPNWTLDVDGDINFNGSLYQNDALVTFGGTSIGNNTDNYILTATGVSDSINGESGLTYNASTDILSTNGLVFQTNLGNSTFFGYEAGNSDDTTTNENAAFGYRAMYNNTSGEENVGIGNEALFANTTSNFNTAIGSQALLGNISGSNTAIGSFSLGNINNASATYNIGLGSSAGTYLNGGSSLTNSINSIFIGALSSANNNGETNQIVIGFNAEGEGSNSIMLGNNAITDLYCYDTSISSPSDKRDKKDIEGIVDALDLVKKLNPVVFTWNMRESNKKNIKDVGFIAQELEEIQQKHLQKDNFNLAKYNESKDIWYAQYSNLIPIYAKAIQEQQIIIESQDKRIRQLEEMVKQLIEKK